MTPRTKEQFEEVRLKRIKQILEATEKVFVAKGTQFDIRDVAKEAGLGYGTVYHYYNNKQILLHELLEVGYAKAVALTEQIFTSPQSPMHQLENYCDTLLKTWMQHTSVYLVYKTASENFSSLEEGFRKQFSGQFQQELYKPLAECLQRAMEAKEISVQPGAEKLANGLLGSLIGSYGIYLYHQEMPSDLSYMTALLLRGLRESEGG